jgi:hypothetical protein
LVSFYWIKIKKTPALERSEANTPGSRQPGEGPRRKGGRAVYLEALVSASRLFMMPSAPTPPEKPFWRVLTHTLRG